MLLFGNNQIGSIYLGDSEVVSIYQGDELIYTASAPITNYVTFTAQEANSTIGLQQLSSNQKLWYSTDGEQWNDMTTTTTITLTNSGDSCYIAGMLRGNNTSRNYTRFKMTGKIEASGNCNYLWNYKKPDVSLKQYCGYYMFYNCTGLTTAPELSATTLANYCYSGMFQGCHSLTTAPALPATTLADRCYEYMFSDCTGLTSAPELPATTLAYGCYNTMFTNCTSLTTAPELPATELVDYCYQYMFYGCRRLNYIKCLAIDISANDCTSYWVNGVASTGTFVKHPNTTGWTTGVNGIPTGWVVEDYLPAVKFTAQEANSTIGLQSLKRFQKMWYSKDLNIWTAMTTSTTITLENINDSIYIRGIYTDNADINFTQFKMTGKISASGNCNYLWNYENPDAPLISECGRGMFASCDSLVTAPELPATTLATSCYDGMFQNCTSLTTAPELPATTLATSCYSNMFSGCTSLTTAPELPAATLARYCYTHMFNNCTNLTTIPSILPATTLVNYCYIAMFYGCTSLTIAPELPATTLVERCYYEMFNGCSNLNYIKCLAVDGINQNGSTTSWVQDVANTGTFVKHPDVTSWTAGNNGIPNGWAVEDYTPVKFTAQQANSTIGLLRLSSYQTLEYSTNGITWDNMTTATTITLENSGDSCYVRGILSSNNNYNTYTQFKMSGKIAASGNCNYLWNYKDPDEPLKQYCGYDMFSGCTSLTTAPELPATVLATSCYSNMFSGCTSLTTAPELPATTLAESCYSNMFSGCTSLTTAPELPATTLAYSCYNSMFSDTNLLPDCTNIDFNNVTGGLIGLFAGTKVNDNDLMNILPINQNSGHYWLPATTLANFCYYNMFQGCSSLTTAPELPATTLANFCYYNMFRGCSSLTAAPELPATTLANYCYNCMFVECTSLTTTPELPATTLTYDCYSAMFQGCTSLTAAPELPATTLADGCYSSMFRGCTSLTTAPELPATTLVQTCYFCMFEGCSNLNYIRCLAANMSASSCTYNWVSGVASVGTFVKRLDVTNWKTGVNGIPTNWTVEDAQ